MQLEVTLSPEAAEGIAARVVALIEERSQGSPWMDVAGVAEYAHMTPAAVRSSTKRGQIKSHRSSTGRVRYLRADVDAFLRGGEEG